MTVENETNNPQEPTPVADVPPSSVEQPAKFSERHTATNTTFNKRLDPATCLIRSLTEEEKEKGYITIFLGNNKESRDKATQLMEPYIKLLTLREYAAAQPEAYAGSLDKQEQEWADYVGQNYPTMSLEDAEEMATRLVSFYSNFVDEIKLRSNAIREKGISNVSDRGGLVSSDISGRKPSLTGKNLKDSDIMQRTAINAADGKLVYDVELRNSFTKLVFSRPSKMEMAALLNDIRSEIKGYVRKVNQNWITLARIATARVVWKFIANRITYSSISNINDFAQLANIIRWTDMDTLTMALLRSYTNQGVHMQLICSGQCGWQDFQLVDPERLVHHRDMHDTPEESAIYANLFNHKLTLTQDETLALIEKANFGLDSNKVYNDNQRFYLELNSPSLNDAFMTFDYFTGKVSPQLADLRQKIIDPEEYETQFNLFYTSLGATEYIHWISKFVRVGDPNSDDSHEHVVSRSKTKDMDDFNKGLMEIIKDDPYLNRTLTKAIVNKTPFLSKTFVGLQNFDCPKCKQNQEVFDDQDGYRGRKLGYTPIDPLMSFFTYIQLILMANATENQEARVEALSE